MAINTGTFFAGVGTTFVILAVGFGGGLMLARSAMEPTTTAPVRADQVAAARVILPTPVQAATLAPSAAAPTEPEQSAEQPAPPKEMQQTAEEKEKNQRAERA